MSRRYEQYCPVARTLELVGERWTLLIVRELLLGPRRFTDLAAGLPTIGTSVLSSRLQQLENDRLIARSTLPPPAASTVYQLTSLGHGLAPVLAAMAAWGMGMLGAPRDDDHIHPRWLVLGLSVSITSVAIPDATFDLRVDRENFHLRVGGGRVRPFEGPGVDTDAEISMSTETLVALARGELDVLSSEAAEVIEIEGDVAAAQRLLAAIGDLTHPGSPAGELHD